MDNNTSINISTILQNQDKRTQSLLEFETYLYSYFELFIFQVFSKINYSHGGRT